MSELIHPFSAPQESAVVQGAGQVPFDAHVELLHLYLAHRDAIVGKIERLLNCQGKPAQYQQDLPLLSLQFKECWECFGTLTAVTRDQARLGDLLEQAHWASGFKPRDNPGNDIVNPVEMLVRGLHLWRQTRWPGHKGRIHYAHILFSLSLLRSLALLTLRLWDGESGNVGARLFRLQGVLDQLWRSSPEGQPRLVRDVRWLIPVAMSPTTDDLSGYLHIMERSTETFPEADRIETHKAGVQTGAGHLRSQLYHLSKQQKVSLDESNLVLLTRKSNALDIALLVQGLVPLLEAYEQCLQRGDIGDSSADTQRLTLAAAICQGVSPDPELFLERLDLLASYSMIEHLCITTDGAGQAVYTATGKRHLRQLQQYAALLERVAQHLLEDCRQSRPVEGEYSPYGVLYGFASNLLELMAFKAMQRDAMTHFSMEDAFTVGAADKRAWVNDWRKLPHIKPDVVKQFEYPQQFAAAISARVEHALHRRIAAGETKAAAANGRLFLVASARQTVDSGLAQMPEVPLRYIVSSNPQIVARHQIDFQEQKDLLHCRLEGEFLVSCETEGGWLAISKDLLTEVLGAGQDVKIGWLPQEARDVLGLMCPSLVVLLA
jgi:hypothetical protein